MIDVSARASARSPRRSRSPPTRRWSTSRKIEQGRTLTEQEIKTLPLTSRNPYNFALLQPGVVGFENNEFGVPRLTANGALLRVNYQIDGSNNTQKDRAGLRQMPMSEVMIREVKVVTTGYAPEFGQTMGLVYNAITPSGTNALQRPGQLPLPARSDSARSRSSSSDRALRTKPPTDVERLHGRPRRPDREGQDALLRRLRAAPSATCRALASITMPPANASRARPRAEPAYDAARPDTEFAIGKVDHQLEQRAPALGPLHLLRQLLTDNIGGGLDSVERATDFADAQHSTAGQFVSTIGAEHAERVPRAVRDPRAELAVPNALPAPARRSTSPASPIRRADRHGQPTPASASRRTCADDRQLHLPARQPQLQGRLRHPVRRRHAHRDAARSSTPSRRRTPTWPPQSGANPFGYTHVPAVLRRARPRL